MTLAETCELLFLSSGAHATVRFFEIESTGANPHAVQHDGELAGERYLRFLHAGALGKVCLIQRGSISFADKVLNCQNSGGIGAVHVTTSKSDPASDGRWLLAAQNGTTASQSSPRRSSASTKAV